MNSDNDSQARSSPRRKKAQISITLDADLKEFAQYKCRKILGIGLSPLIKIFLRTFVTQKGIGFYVGDDDLCQLIHRWFTKKEFEIGRKGCAPMRGPRLRDIYELNYNYRKPTYYYSAD